MRRDLIAYLAVKPKEGSNTVEPAKILSEFVEIGLEETRMIQALHSSDGEKVWVYFDMIDGTGVARFELNSPVEPGDKVAWNLTLKDAMYFYMRDGPRNVGDKVFKR
jgi:hypothetical protein